MLRKLVAVGAIAGAMGGAMLLSAPAQADDSGDLAHANQGTFQIVGVNPCRPIQVAVPGWAGDLGSTKPDSGDCTNLPSNGG